MGYRGDQGSAHFRSSSTSSEHGPNCFPMEEYTANILGTQMVARWWYFVRGEKSYTEFIHVVKTHGFL